MLNKAKFLIFQAISHKFAKETRHTTMKNKITYTLLLALFAVSATAQMHHTNELANMLMRNELSKARQYYKTYIRFIDDEGKLFYSYRTNYLLNRPDSAVYYLNRILENKKRTMFANEYDRLTVHNL